MKSLVRRGLIALALTGLLAAGAGAALAGGTSPTGIVVSADSDGPPGSFGYYGYLDTSRKCRAGRKVKLLHEGDQHVRVIDVDHSSNSGNFGVSSPAPATKIVVPRQKAGRPGHTELCGRGSHPIL
jgi:hypothetical protein